MTAKRRGVTKTRSRKSAPVKLATAPSAGTLPHEDVMEGVVRVPAAFGRGPRKAPRKGARPPRLSNHKVRSQWFRARVAFPVREAPIDTLVAERDRAGKALPTASAAAAAQWEAVGPTNIGGRATSIVCHPQDIERIWLGTAGGGVWFSPNGGMSWTAQWHHQDVLNVGSLAMDPADSNTIYCGTGEANLSADSYPGVGIYRTLNGGAEWHLLAARESTGLPGRIGVIAIDPFDPQHILAGGVGYSEMGAHGQLDLGGIYESRDGGVSWTRRTFISTRNYWCHSIIFDPATRGRIYATFTEQGTKNGIYRSVDGGANWGQLTRGLPAPERIGRTSLVLAPSNPLIIYAFSAEGHPSRSDQVLGVFRSADGGDRWREIGGTHFRNEGQMFYGNTLAVHPTKPNQLICGGVDLHLTSNAASTSPTWKRVTAWNKDRGEPDYAHADHHALLMPEAQPGRIYDVNDGGLDLSEDGGMRWTNRSNGLAVSMFYDADVAQSDPRVFGGGLQDNGTVVTTNGNADMFFEILGGDGGWITFDPKDAGHLYASYQNFNIYRFKGGQYRDVSPPASDSEALQVWMCYIAIDPNDANTVFTGSARVWRTKNDGLIWQAVSPVLDESVISAIEIASANSNRIYVGTENGGIFRSDDGGQTWSANVAGSLLPGFTITRIETSAANENTLYVTVANFAKSHVFRSQDGGSTWADIDKGQLPRVPHHSIVAIPRGGVDQLYVSNDVGVFMSEDDGTHWWNISGNLPNTMVVDLVHHAKENTLLAATYGRSLWRLKL